MLAVLSSAGSWSDTLLHGAVLTCRQQWIWRGDETWVSISTSASQLYLVQVSRVVGLVSRVVGLVCRSFRSATLGFSSAASSGLWHKAAAACLRTRRKWHGAVVWGSCGCHMRVNLMDMAVCSWLCWGRYACLICDQQRFHTPSHAAVYSNLLKLSPGRPYSSLATALINRVPCCPEPGIMLACAVC